MTITQIGQLLRTGKLSCTELLQQTLDDIRRRDVYRSIITLIQEQAMDEAKERDREFATGLDRGPLHGIPIAHKDLYYTKGIPTTAGSLVFRDFVPSEDGAAVSKLRDAGAICLAKANLHELAFGITSKNPYYGFVLNPRDPARIAGGSSGGSATLVAAGLLPLTTGSDTGGSIRVPASYCGIVGLKPTYGRISRRGILPLSFSLDVAGPLASCVQDCAIAMNALATDDPLDPTASIVPVPEFDLPPLSNLNGIRVGVPRHSYYERLDPQVAAAVDAALGRMENLGALISEARTPDLAEMNAVARVVQLSETAAIYANHTDGSQFGQDVWTLIQQGKLLAAHEYVNAQRVRTLFRRDFDQIWKQFDVLVTPTTPIAAPLITDDSVQIGAEREDTRLATTRLVRSINLLGEPALSMPCGKTDTGLPVGLQLIAAPFAEPRLLQIARTLEPHLG